MVGSSLLTSGIRQPLGVGRRIVARDPGQHVLQLVLIACTATTMVCSPRALDCGKSSLLRNTATRRLALEASTATS
jgi:hypothetical protein